MINKIRLENFKSHVDLNLSLKSLTVLVGTNSSGKSSIIQAILLVIHNITNKGKSPLNGHLISLGTFEEATSFVTNAHQFKISATSNETELIELTFKLDDENNDVIVDVPPLVGDFYKTLNYTDNHVHYLSANRIGAQDIYTKNYDRYDRFGIYGEYAIDYLESNKYTKLDDELVKDPFNSSHTLGGQVNYWLNKISNHELETSDIPGTNYLRARYGVRSATVPPVTKYIRPANTGSGVSYLLAILIICLASKKEDIVIIENPEIHLHPKAQALLVEFFVFISNYGIQLILESHSDHIFNGLRVQIHNRTISPNNVSVNFFTKDDETLASEHTMIQIDEDGRVQNHQSFLFDQFDNDINSLLGI